MRGPTLSDDAGFNRFWQAYPRRVSRLDALKAWTKLAPSPELVDLIMDALSWQKTTPQWTKADGAFVPHAASWLRGERWTDEPFETRPVLTYEPWVCSHTPHCPHRSACLVVAARKRA